MKIPIRIRALDDTQTEWVKKNEIEQKVDFFIYNNYSKL